MRGKPRLNFQLCLRIRFLPDIPALHLSIHNQGRDILKMEEDRLESNLAHDAELSVEENVPLRRPRKRFVGRHQAGENSKLGGGSSAIEDNGTIQSIFPSPPHIQINPLTSLSIPGSQDPKNVESGPT